MNLSAARKYRKSHRFWRDLFTDNPALILGVELPFVIVCAYLLRNAVALSVMMLIIHMVTVTIGRMFTLNLPMWKRSAINVTVSTVMMLVSREIVILMFSTTIMNSVGIYLYLMAVNGLTLIQSTYREGPRSFAPIVARSFIEVVAFAGLMLVISFVREYLGNGTLWGIPMPIPFRQTGILYPFYGFIFTGFLLAFMRRINKLMLAMRINASERKNDLAFSAEK